MPNARFDPYGDLIPDHLWGVEEYEFGVMTRDDENDEDELATFCGTPGCVEMGMHYAPSECMTAEDHEAYYLACVTDEAERAYETTSPRPPCRESFVSGFIAARG